MTHDEAAAKGYSIKRASTFEYGLIHNGRGVRTWWASDFGGEKPRLDHPIIARHIDAHEEMLGITNKPGEP